LLAPPTSGVNGSALCCGNDKIGWAMFRHVKIIGLSVGLLVILSGLTGISFAGAW
jgi:hypothetical protein